MRILALIAKQTSILLADSLLTVKVLYLKFARRCLVADAPNLDLLQEKDAARKHLNLAYLHDLQ